MILMAQVLPISITAICTHFYKIHGTNYDSFGEVLVLLHKWQRPFLWGLLTLNVLDLLVCINEVWYYFYLNRDEHGHIVEVHAHNIAYPIIDLIITCFIMFRIVMFLK